MHKEEVLFQPWAVWYHHNHPEKTIGNAKAITVAKDFTGRTSLASASENAKTALGNMTNNLLSSLHAHSETVTVLEG